MILILNSLNGSGKNYSANPLHDQLYICWGYSLTVSIIKNYDSTQTGHFLDEQFHVKFVLLMSYRLYIVAYTDSKKLENIERKSRMSKGGGGAYIQDFIPVPHPPLPF